MDIMHQKYLSISRLFFICVFAFTLSACGSLQGFGESVDVSQAPQLTPQEYEQKAQASTGSTQAGWNIVALKANIAQGNYDAALTQLNSINPETLTEKQNAEWMLARAQIQQYQKVAPATILSSLNFNKNWSLEDSQWARYHTLRSDLMRANKDYLNSSRELISSRYYQDVQTHQAISDGIWDNMMHYNSSQLQGLNVASDESELQGWIFVATQVKTNANDRDALNSRLQSWYEINPTHPIVTNPPQQLQSWINGDASQPKNIALLLPLSGKFGTQGQTIRDGFIHAMTNDSTRPLDMQLNVIDTASTDVNSIYQQLSTNQTDFVVGPLIKSNIESFQALNANGAIPMLALNFPGTKKEQLSSCYLTLSPEQEAEQAAIHIYQKGLRKPLVIVPRNKLGERMRNAFQAKWKSLTGDTAATGSFGDTSSMASSVRAAFSGAGGVDATYIIATRSELTLLKPYVDVSVSSSSQMPIFTSSRSNPSPIESYLDLHGVEYSDIPAIVEPDPSFKAEYNTLFPDSSYAEIRLHSLGMDAYSLIAKLPVMKLSDTYAINGQTGRLTMGQDCTIDRELSWGVYDTFAAAAAEDQFQTSGSSSVEDASEENTSDDSAEEAPQSAQDVSDVEPNS